MRTLNSDNDSPKGNLRNFDLSVDEIRLIKSIDEMNVTVNRIQQLDPQSPRIKYIRLEIKNLEGRLDDLRDNTLIS
ncbi:MAG: hypothetical protein HOM14_02395 [Gammaproteobacteria bacterium]|jgi:hypothetical protein|nr:hypothetical protein [Gammaproteobacteria bacterium]MBT3724743.1 hypothetical protein [Gammaproteobacteria bacterium]MBT4078937.1 hypothetical protein [Gammaproteobacteria bacterium]MBT4195508.1 hypothetical protein [Gammaproteobacteria bacterium]MBT4448770.1 hypothetical protein [Gammaproteobacteria bacterium]